MIYVCAGMYRSGSTWLYNAMRHTLEAAGVKNLAAGWASEKAKLLTHENALVKIHEFDPALASRDNVVLVSHRDLRDVAASLTRKFKKPATIETVREGLDAYTKWAAVAAYDLRYETLLRDKESELRRIARCLRIPAAVVDQLPYEAILKKIESEKFSEERSTGEGFDSVNLLHEGHMTDGRHGSWKETLPAELVTEIETEFGQWLTERRYPTAATPLKERLSDHVATVYAQFGEDGIIAKIFSIIGTQSKTCVEFGAWDGFRLANTANLWARQGWKGVLIEAVPERYEQLKVNVKNYNVRCVQAFVQISGDNSLENILQKEGLTGELDLLSIDIDSDDYYIFQSLTWLKPRVLICEYNPTIPPPMELVPAPGNHIGCAALSLIKLGEKKGYKLVAVTETNCIFVRAEDFPKFAQFETDFEKIAVTTQVTYFISSYDGDFVLSRPPTYGWGKPLKQEFAVGSVYKPEIENKGSKKLKPWHVLRPAERKIRQWRKQAFKGGKS